jgi:iron complex outermembrane recepter protein
MKTVVPQHIMTERNHRDSQCIWPSIFTFLTFGLVIFAGAFAQTEQALPPPSALKKLSVEELMDIEVTSVSKRPERLSETASAIQVITQEDIRRSGATRLPEALRLASNLEVAQVDSRQWPSVRAGSITRSPTKCWC